MDDFFTPKKIVLTLGGLVFGFFFVATLPHILGAIF